MNFKAYFRPPETRTASTDKSRKDPLPIGIKVPGGRRELLTLEEGEQLFRDLNEALSCAKNEQ